VLFSTRKQIATEHILTDQFVISIVVPDFMKAACRSNPPTPTLSRGERAGARGGDSRPAALINSAQAIGIITPVCLQRSHPTLSATAIADKAANRTKLFIFLTPEAASDGYPRRARPMSEPLQSGSARADPLHRVAPYCHTVAALPTPAEQGS